MSELVRERVRGVAGNPATPPELLVRMLDHGPAGQAVLIFRAHLPDEVCRAAAAHPDVRIRLSLADSWHATPEQRALLVDDARPAVRTALAAGPDLFRATPDPLPEPTYARLAADPVTRVREAVADSWQCPPSVRARLVGDPDPVVRISAYARWADPPEEVTDRLLADPDVRRAVARRACRHRPELLAEVLDATWSDGWELSAVAIDARLDRASAERLARHGDTGVRAAVAENPHLPRDLVDELSVDPDPKVRLRLSLRPGLTEAERAAVDYRVRPTDRLTPARWVLDCRDDPDALDVAVRSAHIGLRRSAAYSPHLRPDQVARLAADEDFAVRLLLCENHDGVPGDVLLATYLEAQVITAGMLVGRPNFPRVGLARLADSADPRARMLVRHDPEAPADLIDRLSRDPDEHVRWSVAADPRLQPDRLAELLDDPATTGAAARNPNLSADHIERILAEAGILGAAATSRTGEV
ncbi:LRV domain-containing protein [Micromonospora sp. AP08]|uniref:LRV domain-containing protein n=1 Tax=Micromonospora sp. AP08 TaxID=2604467 RepID=UPI0011DB0904|nr:LRV domain-containing protein [Micromonospora sp. AP08]TYB38558.1 LRV domain-containing protein [Micromonospora sp. AP08]